MGDIIFRGERKLIVVPEHGAPGVAARRDRTAIPFGFPWSGCVHIERTTLLRQDPSPDSFHDTEETCLTGRIPAPVREEVPVSAQRAVG